MAGMMHRTTAVASAVPTLLFRRRAITSPSSSLLSNPPSCNQGYHGKIKDPTRSYVVDSFLPTNRCRRHHTFPDVLAVKKKKDEVVVYRVTTTGGGRISSAPGDCTRSYSSLLRGGASSSSSCPTSIGTTAMTASGVDFKKAIRGGRGRNISSCGDNIPSGVRWHGGGPPADAPRVNVTFIDPKIPEGEEGRVKTVEAAVGENVMRLAHRYDIDLEGACEGVRACSTCHVILEDEVYDQLEEPTEEEEDMLDMAFGLTDTSRLGCQVEITEEMDGMEVTLPAATRNFYVDGHVPKPH